MSDQNSRARVTADIVDEIALPSDDAEQLLSRLSRSKILGDAAIDPKNLIRQADLGAHDLAIVELVTRSATPALILSTLKMMQLRPAELADGLRVLLSPDENQRQRLPYLFLNVDGGSGRAWAMSHAYDDVFTVVEVSIADDPSNPEDGWSEHFLMICGHAASRTIEAGTFQPP